MSAGEASIAAGAPLPAQPGRGGFPPAHRADAFFLPAIVAFIWVGLLFGFVPRIVDHFSGDKPPYLAIVNAHAVVFVGWMLLLSAQVALVRSRNVALHRRLGQLGLVLAPVLVIVGLITSVIVDVSHFGTPRWDPQFLSIQGADLLNFGIFAGAALALRRDGAGHKRLMLLAATALGNAGFGRWWAPGLHDLLGEGFVSELMQDFAGDFLIVALLVGYDLATRGQVHRVLRWGAPLLVGVEALSVFLYLSPGWIAFAGALLHP